VTNIAWIDPEKLVAARAFASICRFHWSSLLTIIMNHQGMLMGNQFASGGLKIIKEEEAKKRQVSDRNHRRKCNKKIGFQTG
jgi:hypothetical protein